MLILQSHLYSLGKEKHAIVLLHAQPLGSYGYPVSLSLLKLMEGCPSVKQKGARGLVLPFREPQTPDSAFKTKGS